MPTVVGSERTYWQRLAAASQAFYFNLSRVRRSTGWDASLLEDPPGHHFGHHVPMVVVGGPGRQFPPKVAGTLRVPSGHCGKSSPKTRCCSVEPRRRDLLQCPRLAVCRSIVEMVRETAGTEVLTFRISRCFLSSRVLHHPVEDYPCYHPRRDGRLPNAAVILLGPGRPIQTPQDLLQCTNRVILADASVQRWVEQKCLKPIQARLCPVFHYGSSSFHHSLGSIT